MTVPDAALPLPTGNELAGKVALVTGGGRNIGAAISLALAAAGAGVAINTRKSKDDAEAVAQKIRADGGQAEVYVADISDGQQVKSMVEAVVKRFGRLDILVLNASIRTEKPFLELEYEEWRVPLAITLDGAFYCTKACAPHMIKAGGGAIVTLGGLQALSGAKSRVHGSVAKSGLVGFTRALSRDLAPHGIRVNCVSPGHIETVRANPRAARDDQKKVIPIGRFGETRELASAVRFLAGPGASFITGQTLHVNGGQTNF